MPVIEALDLIYEYNPGRGVCGLSMSVGRGECYAILGRNGSGKSTLTRLILGLERRQSGRLNVLGRPVKGRSRQMLEKVGAVLDTSPHWENLSGFQNVFFAASSYGMSRRQAEVRVKELLDRSGLKDQAHEPVGTYSFGMRRKLSLIQAFVSDPELMVLDEPTAGVDAHFMAAMTEMIRARCETGKTTFITSNDPEWLAGTVSQVAFMEAGQIIEQGTVDELVARVSTLTEVRISLEDYFRLPDPPMAGIRSFTQTGNVATVFMDKDPLLFPRLIEWISQEGRKIRAIETLGNSLREVFLLRTGKELE